LMVRDALISIPEIEELHWLAPAVQILRDLLLR